MRGLSQTGQGMSKWKSLGDDFLIFVIKAGLGAFCFSWLGRLKFSCLPRALAPAIVPCGKAPSDSRPVRRPRELRGGTAPR